MHFLFLIFGGWVPAINNLIWGIILGIFGQEELSTSLKGTLNYYLNPKGFDVTGELGDNMIFNLFFLLFGGGIIFIVGSFVWGIILGLLDKDLGAAIKGNAMQGLSLATNKWTAK